MQSNDSWLLLIVSLPSRPSSLRVRAWRRLRALGAIALKNSVYVLPSTPDSHEQLLWLAQEVQKDGGEATLVQTGRIENIGPEELIRLFREARDQDYRRLAERCRALLRRAERHAKGQASARWGETLARLSRDAERVRAVDFFEASGWGEVERLREVLAMRLRPAESPAGPRPGLRARRGSRWVTRPRPHVDRIGSAWLVKRFIDPDAQFLFAPPERLPPDAIPFDTPGADLGHHGNDCTFETLLRRAGLADRRLEHIAEIVHEADLRDQKFHREEAAGFDLAIRALVAAVDDDDALLAQGLVLFDGLYATLGHRR